MASKDARVTPAEVCDWRALRVLVDQAIEGPQCPGPAEIAADADGGLQFWRTRLKDMIGAKRFAAFAVVAGERTGFVAAYVDGEGADRCVVVRHLFLRPGVAGVAPATSDLLLDAVERWAVGEEVPQILLEVCCGREVVLDVLEERGYVEHGGGPAPHSGVVDGQARILSAARWTRRLPLAAVGGDRAAALAAS